MFSVNRYEPSGCRTKVCGASLSRSAIVYGVLCWVSTSVYPLPVSRR
jgi:hypothetical protein